MDPKNIARFHPKRFAPEPRKQVHWPVSSSPAHKTGSQTSPPSASSPPSSPPPSQSRNYLQHALSWFPVVVIISYLLIRDGWIAYIASQCSSHMSSFGLPARWQRSPLPRDTRIDEHVFEYLWGPALHDWALSTDGALIYPEYTSPYNHSAPLGSPWHPGVALTDDSRVGRCWSIPASHGQLGIALPEFIYPTNVTIDHIPKAIAADPGQAPRRMVLWGIVDGDGNRARYSAHLDAIRGNQGLTRDAPPLAGEGEDFLVLAEFMFDVNGSHYIQTFPTSPTTRDLGIYVGTVVLEIMDNWGSESTCIYRVRIHGELAEPDLY